MHVNVYKCVYIYTQTHFQVGTEPGHTVVQFFSKRASRLRSSFPSGHSGAAYDKECSTVAQFISQGVYLEPSALINERS